MSPLNQADKRKYGHPTIKPLPLIESIVRNSSREGQLILDPFMGSGTTGVACKLTGRNFIGIELNKEYFKIAKQRIKDCS
jgi:DNA modification methylase